MRLRYGGYFAAAAKSALDLAAKRDQLSKEEMVHVYRIIGQLMETSSQLLYYVDADATTRNNLVKLLNNWVTSPKMLAEGFVISRTVQGSQTKLYQFILPNLTNQSSRVFPKSLELIVPYFQDALRPAIRPIVRGLVRIPNFDSNNFIKRQLKEIIVIYLPRFPTQNAAQWHPLTGLLLPGEVAPQTRRSKLIVIFMEIVRNSIARCIG